MDRISLILIFLLLWNKSFSQQIENIVARQEGDTILVSYDLLGDSTIEAFNITILCSTNGGKSWGDPLIQVSGDVGPNIKSGTNKMIRWDVLKELSQLESEDVVFKIIAQIKTKDPNKMYVAGVIKNKKGVPLSEIKVTVEGDDKKSSSDLEGKFVLHMPRKGTISFIGDDFKKLRIENPTPELEVLLKKRFKIDLGFVENFFEFPGGPKKSLFNSGPNFIIFGGQGFGAIKNGIEVLYLSEPNYMNRGRTGFNLNSKFWNISQGGYLGGVSLETTGIFKPFVGLGTNYGFNRIIRDTIKYSESEITFNLQSQIGLIRFPSSRINFLAINFRGGGTLNGYKEESLINDKTKVLDEKELGYFFGLTLVANRAQGGKRRVNSIGTELGGNFRFYPGGSKIREWRAMASISIFRFRIGAEYIHISKKLNYTLLEDYILKVGYEIF